MARAAIVALATVWRPGARLALEPRHRESGEPVGFVPPAGGFAAHAEECRARIARARARAGWQAAAEAVALAAPFERRPPGVARRGSTFRRGALLLHGLSDTPFQMRDLARLLAETEGCLVRAPLLPGHGTVPGDLLRADRAEWARAVRWGIETFRGEVERLYAVGFSTGAALAIETALEGAPFAGLILISPAIAVSPLAAVAHWHRALSWANARGAWYELHADRDPLRFESLPHQAVHQVHALTQSNRVRAQAAPLSQPLLVVQSEDDATVDAAAALRFFRAHRHPASRIILCARAAGIAGNDLDTEGDPRVARIAPGDATDSPGQGDERPPVISFSHLALPYHPDNPHYGRHGGYRNCLHYDDGSDEAAAEICRDERLFALSPAACYGEKTLVSESRLLRRLTWNPRFEELAREIGEFLERVEN